MQAETVTAESREWRRAAAPALGAAAVVGIPAVLLRPETMPASTAVLAILIASLGLVPLAHFLARPAADRPAFPLFVLTGAFYAVFFGLSAFTAELLREPDTGRIAVYGWTWIDGIGATTQIAIVAGLVSMIATYAAARRPLLRLPRFTLPAGLDNRRARLAFWAFLAAHLAYAAVPALRGIASIGQLLQPAGFLAFAGFYILWRRRELGGVEASLVLLALLVDLAFVLRSTSTLPIVLMATMFLALEWALKGRLLWVCMLVVLISMPPLYMAAQIVRAPLWMAQTNVGLADVPMVLFKTVRHWAQGKGAAPSAAPGDAQWTRVLGASNTPGMMVERLRVSHISLARRINHAALMEEVVRSTPERVPYWRGETYRPLLTSWIPRFLWPGKPREETGWTFGRRYEILKADDPPQSINLPWMIEMYANFGGPGVVLGMGIVGVLFAFLEGFLSRSSMAPAEIAAGTAVVLPLFMQDSNFSLMTGSVVLLILAFWIALAAASKIPLPPARAP